MPLDRRRLLKSLAIAAPLCGPAAAQALAPDAPLTTAALHTVSTFNGTSLPDDRLAILQPVLDRRRAQLQTLRAVELPDSLSPTTGPLNAKR